MIARCQFDLYQDGHCWVHMTYPIKGCPWRRSPTRTYNFEMDAEKAGKLFREVEELPQKHPGHCLEDANIWSDDSEKGCNVVTWDDATNTVCRTLSIADAPGQYKAYFSMREDSEVLLQTELYSTIISLIQPYQSL